MDSNQFREAAIASIDDIAKYYDTIDERKVLPDVKPGYLRELVPSSAPEEPESWEAIHADVGSKILPGITHWQSPSFMAFFPCSGSYPAMLAEMYSNAFNGAHFNWICSPAVTELETIVLNWLARMLALPECYLSTSPTRGGGVIHGSASEAIMTVMVAARDKYLREALAHLPEESDERDEEEWKIRSRLVALGSAASHSSTKKAAQILGVRCVSVPVTEESSYAMTGDALAKVLAECKAKNLRPFYLTATLGTTDTCAVDDFSGIATALREAKSDEEPEVFVHVDAAYAGSALVLPEHQHLTREFASFHSVNLNPHKWMLVNFDCSTLWVRDRAWLVQSLSIKPPYLRNQFSEAGLVTDYRDWQIPLGRRFRSLKLWFVLRSYGVKGIQAHIRTGIEFCEQLGEMLRSRSDLFTIMTGPRFALVVLRCVGREGATLEERNKLTDDLCEAVNQAGEIYLTPSMLNGVYAIRVCTGVSARMEDKHIKKAFDVLVNTTENLLKAA